MPPAPSQGLAELENGHQHGPNATPRPLLPRSPPSRSPPRPPPASPPDLTRGHRTPRPALRLSPVNGDGERKEPSAYARSEPAEPAANEKGSSDRPANHLRAARPGGAASRTVALTTAHSSHPWRERAPHHLSPWLGQPIASRVPALGLAHWSTGPGGANLEAALAKTGGVSVLRPRS